MTKKIPDRLKSYKGVTPIRPHEWDPMDTAGMKNIRFILCDEANYGNRVKGSKVYKDIRPAVDECLKLNKKCLGNSKLIGVSPRFYVSQVWNVDGYPKTYTFEEALN